MKVLFGNDRETNCMSPFHWRQYMTYCPRKFNASMIRCYVFYRFGFVKDDILSVPETSYCCHWIEKGDNCLSIYVETHTCISICSFKRKKPAKFVSFGMPLSEVHKMFRLVCSLTQPLLCQCNLKIARLIWSLVSCLFYIDGSAQLYGTCSGLAMELQQFCSKPSIWYV